jgi:xylitol oxidase
LASLAEISVGGATATGVHGSGNGLGCLATQIRSMELILADGSVQYVFHNDPRLKALAVGLGAFGVVTAVELGIEPTYNVTNHVFLKFVYCLLFKKYN